MNDELADLMRRATRITGPDEVALLPIDTVAVFAATLDDSMVEALLRLQGLRVLVQSGNSSITDTGLTCLERLETLEVLDLEWSEGITGEGIQSLRKLPNLRWLDLSFCSGVAPADVSELRRVLPDCEIEFYGR